jgi:amino acid adenylation domain-containing protein
MVEDSGAGVLLTHGSLLDKLPEFEGHKIAFDHDQSMIAQESEADPVINVAATNLAYVTYTSGSTGKPKGVAVPHQAVNRLLINTDYVELRASDLIGQVSNCSFDAATFEIWGALLHGARLIVIPTDVAISPRDFAKRIAKDKITVLFLTTALVNQIVGEVPKAFRHIRHLLFGGEAVDPRWIAELLKHGAPERLSHVYGPTESTTFATSYLVESVSQGARTIPIGRPIAQTQLFVLDRYLERTPVGIAGELYIGGDGLARGYLNRPDLTAERFVPNPFCSESPTRLYRTGDLVRYLPDGNIEFIGRKDYQVKIRGFRIEPGEIENALAEHPAVQRAIVTAREDMLGEKRLVAYVVSHHKEAVTPTELRTFLKTRLPDYLVPSALMIMDEFALTPNGKIDRERLPVPDGARPESQISFLAPRNFREVQLTQIWERLLGIQRIGVRDNFFDLGGHSLLAVHVVNEVEKIFGSCIKVPDLFKAPTIEQLAQLIPNQQGRTELSSLIAIQSKGTKPPLFCVHGFLSYLHLARQLGSDQPLYGLAQHVNGQRIRHTRIEDIAAHYVDEIQKVHPQGPYFLAGHSIGGLIAFEMSQQLRERGYSVALLALIEPTPPKNLRAESGNECSYSRVLRHARTLGGLSEAEKISYIFDRIKVKVETRVKTIACQIYDFFGRSLPNPLQTFYLEDWIYGKIYPLAARRYEAKIYPGRIVLFRSRLPSEQPSADHASPRVTRWEHLAGNGLEVHEISGSHLEIIKPPHVWRLAQKLQECLENAVIELHAPQSTRTRSYGA